MSLEKKLLDVVSYDRKEILDALKQLRKELEIDKKISDIARLNDDIDSIFLRSINLNNTFVNINKQLKENSDKKLELRCIVKGKQYYLKSFGIIKEVPNKVIIKVFEFIYLHKILKSLYEAAIASAKFDKLKTFKL